MAEGSTSSKDLLKNLFIGILISSLTYFYFQKPDLERKRVANVLSGLLLEERSVNASTSLPIAVGFGSCLDLFVDGIPLMKALGIAPPKQPRYHEKMETLEQVGEMFALYLSEGAAVERFIPSSLLKHIVDIALKVNASRWAAGGNAPVISNRFAKEGFQNTFVGAHSSEKFNELYPSDLKFTHTTTEEDDIHLILEFKVNNEWGPYKVQRANRFIVHSDHLNPYIKSLESFAEKIKEVQPRLIVLGALQMLDNFPFLEGERESRMSSLKDLLVSLPETSLVHFEMASFSEVAMMKSVIDNIMLHSDSLGMNEQELPNIVSMLKQSTIIKVADSNPRTAIVLDQMRDIYKHFKIHSRRGLSRIHVHTLSFQAILFKDGSSWKNLKAGAAKASLVAHRHVCGDDIIQVDKSRLIMDDSFQLSLVKDSGRIYFNETSPIPCWKEDDYEICLAPVLVCTKVKQTVGGGDNITPAGLMLQI